MIEQDKIKTVEEIISLENNFTFFIENNKSMNNKQMQKFLLRLQKNKAKSRQRK